MLNQSDARLKPITTWSPAFSRALCSLVGFIWSSHWLIHVFSFLLIGRCDCFQGQHTPGKLGAVSSEDDEDDFSPYGETSRDEAKEGLVSYRILLSFNVDQHIVLALSSSFNHHYLYLIYPVIQKLKEKNWPNQNLGDYGKRVFIRLVFFMCFLYSFSEDQNPSHSNK